MPLLATGALANWHDLAGDEHENFDPWHTQEHISERLSVPGFRRRRRYAALAGAPRYFILYETETVETFRSPADLERVRHLG